MRWATPYQGATACTSGPTGGADALLDYLLEAYPLGWSGGIYNCRTVRGGSTTSLHGEGRAVDLMLPIASNGRGTAYGGAIVAALGARAADLGIQCAIYDRTIWSAASRRGRGYTGTHPHYDHIHVELTRAAARSLTVAQLRAVLGTGVPVELGDRLLRLAEPYMRGDDVRAWQQIVAVEDDGVFGPDTAAATEAWQRSRALVDDGVVGPKTLAATRPTTAAEDDMAHLSEDDQLWLRDFVAEARKLDADGDAGDGRPSSLWHVLRWLRALREEMART